MHSVLFKSSDHTGLQIENFENFMHADLSLSHTHTHEYSGQLEAS